MCNCGHQIEDHGEVVSFSKCFVEDCLCEHYETANSEPDEMLIGKEEEKV
jgi:hypothetical protein